MSLGRKIKTKWFIVANILLAIIIIGVINIDNVITFFGGDFNKKQEIYVIDNTEKSYSAFEQQMKAAEKTFYSESEESLYEIKLYDKDLESAKKLIEEEPSTWVVVFDTNSEKIGRAHV